jgi:Protein of unknown function (DUF3108)
MRCLFRIACGSSNSPWRQSGDSKIFSTVLFLALLSPLSAETLHYSINWPSGLSLGEADISSTPAAAEKPAKFEAHLDASLPGFALRDHYVAVATNAFCSVTLSKDFEHGSRKGADREIFHQDKGMVTRGDRDFSVGACARDALTFLAFARHELSQGRIAPSEPVVFGSIYKVRMEFLGTEAIKVGDQRMDADRMRVNFKGPASDYTFELYFSKDAARVPVFAKLPLPLGMFTVELIH